MRTQHRSRTISDFSYRPVVAAVALALTPMAAHATNFVVTTNADSGAGSLRDAINNANSACTGSDVISFNGPFTIDLASDLPWINCGNLSIAGPGTQNASTAPVKLTSSTHGAFNGLVTFASPNPSVRGMEIYGFNYGGGFGLLGDFNSSNNRIHDNSTGIKGGLGSSITRNRVWSNNTGIFVDYGGQILSHNIVYDNNKGIDIEFTTKNGPVLTNNFIGLDDGSSPGLRPSGNNNGIFSYGSTFVATGNVISNNDTGIQLQDDQSSTISGNLIGTNAAGTGPLGNFIGISSNFSYGTQIIGNTISSNSDYGIDMFESVVTLIDGNSIGTDGSKTLALLNGGGVRDNCGGNNQTSHNVIGTSGGHGIELAGVFGGGDLGTVVSNKIGVKGDGVTPLGNNAYGIFLSPGNCGGSSNFSILSNNIRNSTGDGIFIQASYGGDIEQNTITGNHGYGINDEFFNFGGGGNQILNNKIYGNATSLSGTGRKNINLGAPGAPRANDSFDTDFGPNDGQNWPNIDSVLRDVPNNRTLVNFTLDGGNANYTIEAYANPSGSHVPGGELRVVTITGFFAYGGTTGQIILPGLSLDHISLTATQQSIGDTSEFSPVVDAQPMPSLVVNPTTVDFGGVAAGTDSPPRTINVISAGGVDLNLTYVGDSSACYGGSLCYGGDFTCSSTCVPGTLASGHSCSITATFHPPGIGPFGPQTIYVCTGNAGGQTVSLVGTGTPPPIANFSPGSFDFGPVTVNTQSPPQSFRLTNPNVFSVGLSAPSTTNGDFNVTDTNCPAFLAAGDNCSVSVAFDPSSVGPESAQLLVGANTSDVVVTNSHGVRAAGALTNGLGPPPAVANLRGTGVVQANLTMPDAVDLGAYLVGAPAIVRSVTITASGTSALTFNGITEDGPFVLTNNCPATLQPGDSCDVVLAFSQQVLGPYTGTLTVSTNAQGGTRTIPITAHTVAIAAPHISVSPDEIGFGNRMFLTTSSSQTITITSDGTGPATLAPVAASTLDFLITASTCPVSLAVGASCTADVALRPVGFGMRQGEVLVTSNSPDSPAVVRVSGTGCRPFNAATARLGDSLGCLP